MFAKGRVALRTKPLHTVRALDLEIPKGRLTVVTGVSGSGKTTLVLESLVPALKACIAGEAMPAHIEELEAAGIKRANLIDATPVGANVRSTVATYCGVLDDLRKLYAASPEAKKRKLKAGDFHTTQVRCAVRTATARADNDGRAVPSRCRDNLPSCGGGRYSEAARGVTLNLGGGEISLPELMALTVDQAREKLSGVKGAGEKLRTLSELGLGYLTLGEATPALSGGEAQRLKLAAEMGARARRRGLRLRRADDRAASARRARADRRSEPPYRTWRDGRRNRARPRHDSERRLRDRYGAGRRRGGRRIVAAGTPEEVAASPESVTGRYIAEALRPLAK